MGLNYPHKVRVQYEKPTSAGITSFADGWGVVKSLELIGAGPVGLIHAREVEIQYKKSLGLKLI